MTMIAFPKRPPLIKTALLGGVAVVASAWAAGPASAEGTVNADAPTDTEYASAEITVTARKREERIQDVPLSISAVGGNMAKKEQLTQIGDFAQTLAKLNPRTANQIGRATGRERGCK